MTIPTSKNIPKRKLNKMIFMFPVILLAILLSGWWYFQSKQTQQLQPNTYTVSRGDIREVVKATGEVYASEIVSVGAQVSGQIKQLYIRLGQDVKKGELIAEIDSTTQLNQLENSKADLESAKAELAANQISLQTEQQNYQRKVKLYRADAEAKEEVERAINSLKRAQAMIATQQLKIKQLQNIVNTAQTELGYTQIRSPITGTVVSMPVEAGQTINFSQTTPLIATIANLEKMEIRMQVAEGDYTKLKTGMAVRFSTLADPKVNLEGTVQSIDPALVSLTKGTYNEKSENTNSAVFYYARMVVNNPQRKLSIGMTTQNEILINARKNVLTLPKVAVIQEDSTAWVYVYHHGKPAEKRKIHTGIADFNQIEVLSELKEGELILLEPPEDHAANTKDGAAV